MTAQNALEPFLLLAKGAKSAKGAASIIDRATQEAGVFAFGELLDVPAVKEVRKGRAMGESIGAVWHGWAPRLGRGCVAPGNGPTSGDRL